MKFFEVSLDKVIMRFFAMMVTVIVPFLLGVPYLAILACPVFLSAMLGVKFSKSQTRNEANLSVLSSRKQLIKAA